MQNGAPLKTACQFLIKLTYNCHVTKNSTQKNENLGSMKICTQLLKSVLLLISTMIS